jgi:aminopeptidase
MSSWPTSYAGAPIDRLAQVLVQYSTAVKAGDIVSLVGPPLAEPLILSLYREVLSAGGHPIVFMSPESCTELLYRHGGSEQLSFVSPLEACEVETADVIIHVIAPSNTRALSGIDPAGQALHNRARRPLMERFLSRAAEKSLRWVVTQMPCQAAAQEANMSLTEYEDFVFRAGLLDRTDPASAWQALSRRQATLIETLARARELRIATPHGTDLRLTVEDRAWLNGDGHENFPDGEVFTAPVESATEGTLQLDLPAVYKGTLVAGARLVFRAGQVVNASAEQGEDFLIRMLDQDPGARVLGEVALGCNYGIARHTRNTLFDEKIGGTFHVALGASYPACGGKNKSALHWDLVADLRPGGRIEADGQLLSENGRFLHPNWSGAV